MTSKRIEMGLVIIVLVTVLSMGVVTAQTSNCRSVIIGLAPCLNYITGNSSTPSSSCCSQLSNVVQSQPQCLCSLLNNGVGATLGLAINQTLALALPSVCNIQTPSLSRCNAAVPTISPTATPADSPAVSSSDAPGLATPADSPAVSSNDAPGLPISPTASDIPSENGSKTVPSTTNGNTSDGNIVKGQLHLLVVLIFIASYASSTLTTSFRS